MAAVAGLAATTVDAEPESETGSEAVHSITAGAAMSVGVEPDCVAVAEAANGGGPKCDIGEYGEVPVLWPLMRECCRWWRAKGPRARVADRHRYRSQPHGGRG